MCTAISLISFIMTSRGSSTIVIIMVLLLIVIVIIIGTIGDFALFTTKGGLREHAAAARCQENILAARWAKANSPAAFAEVAQEPCSCACAM